MINGLATVVRYRDGTLNVVHWTGGPDPGDGCGDGAPEPDAARRRRRAPRARRRQPLWGVTLGGVPAVWRTALGIDAQGDLVYAAAPNQTSATLARIMVLLHCVRAMQLDINPEWPIFVTYAGAGRRGTRPVRPQPSPDPRSVPLLEHQGLLRGLPLASAR